MIDATKDPEEKRNITNTFNFLKEKRMQKILIYLAYEKTVIDEATSEEAEIYGRMKSLIKNDKIQQSTKIKINIDIPEIITSKGSKLGPYNKDEVVEINENDDVKFIIENNIGNKIS